MFTGCGSTVPGSRVTIGTTGVKDVIQSEMAAESSTSSAAEESMLSVPDEETTVTEPITGQPDSPEIITEEADVDLTVDNADLVYAQVFAMLYTPEDYIGKTVKMKGQFVFYYDEEKDQYYYACIIKDALACCAQGLSHGGSSLFLIRQDQYIVTPQQIRDIICI